MTTLIHPTNRQPCAFVEYSRGHIALRLTCTVTPAVQWFSLAQIEVANPVHTCEHDSRLTGMVYGCAIPQNFDSGLLYDQPQPYVQPLIIALPADMIGQTPITAGKNKRPTIPGVILADCAHVLVIEPPTLWHDSMKVA